MQMLRLHESLACPRTPPSFGAQPVLHFLLASLRCAVPCKLLCSVQLQSRPLPCSVLVVVSALEEVVNEPPLIKTILHQLQLHNTSHAHTRLKAYLVLTKIDKVVEEDIQARILDRLMAGLQADSE